MPTYIRKNITNVTVPFLSGNIQDMTFLQIKAFRYHLIRQPLAVFESFAVPKADTKRLAWNIERRQAKGDMREGF
jgi:hypothetical protein